MPHDPRRIQPTACNGGHLTYAPSWQDPIIPFAGFFLSLRPDRELSCHSPAFPLVGCVPMPYKYSMDVNIRTGYILILVYERSLQFSPEL